VPSVSKKFETENYFLWILVTVPLFFLPISIDVFNFPKQWILVSLTLGALLHNQISRRFRVSSETASNKPLLWLLLSLSLLVIASGLFTETTLIRAFFGYPGRANGILTFLAIFILIWVGSTMAITPVFQRELQTIVVFLFAIVGLYSLIQFLNFDPVKWNNSYNRIIGTFGNPNFSGAFLGVSALITLYASLYSSRKNRFYFALFSVILLFLALATESLQAVGIFVIGILIIISAFVYQRFKKWKFMIFSSAVILISTFVMFSFLGYGPLGEKFYQNTLNLRLNYWRVGIETAGSFPWLGVGPDSYVEGFRLFRGADFVTQYSNQVESDSAHNTLINFMANFGIPAFLLLLFMIFLISRRAVRILFLRDDTALIVRIIALIWILMLIQSLFSLEQIGLVVFQWCCGALLLNHEFTKIRSEGFFKENNLKRIQSESFIVGLKTELSILVVIFTLIASWPFLRQNINLRDTASASVTSGVSETAISEERDKYGDYVEIEIARAIYLTSYLMRAQRYDQVEEIMKRILLNDPDAVEALEQLARLALFRSDYLQELSYRKLIEKKDPFNYENLLNIAQNLESQGQLPEAKTYAERILQLSRNSTINETATAILKS
jgi:O-antigen ligase